MQRSIPSLLVKLRNHLTQCLALGACLVAANVSTGQEFFVLQDNTPSPSDQSAANLAPDEGPIGGSLSDSPVESQPNTPTIPQPSQPGLNNQSARPNVASLGDNRLNLLSQSNYYASPIALSLGASGTTGSGRTSYFGSSAHRNLLKTPEMFGDFRRPGSSVLFDIYSGGGGYSETDGGHQGIDTPSGASFGGMRVSENNVALPQDRIWTSYHHMHGAFQLPTGDVDLDRFIFGFEKTFLDGSASLEFRLPIVGSLDPTDPSGNTSFAGGSFGNLDIILKRVLYATSDRVIAAGLRVETPTGSKWHQSDISAGPAAFTLDPHALYITPYLGTLREIDDIWFINSFLQLDIATGGDRLLASLNGNPAQEFRVNQPPLLQIDLGGGVWLVTPSQDTIGCALISELHLATALDDDDVFAVDPNFNTPNVIVDDIPIRNLLNITNGIHAQLSNELSVRTAISVPILNDRIFDTEVMVQINRNY